MTKTSTTTAKATPAQTLIAAGYTKIRATDECGEALSNSGSSLNGLACIKRAVWAKDGEPDRCAQHAILFI